MKKRLFTLSLSLMLALLAPTSALAVAVYSDIPQDHWATESVDRVTILGIFNGVSNDEFGFGQPITRAAFTTALVRLFDWEEISPAEPSFPDVAANDWFYTAVETAKANNVIAPTDVNFRPDENITRQEMAAMIVRGLGYTSLAGALSSYDSPFTDVTANKGFITIAYDLGIVSGTGEDKFSPDSTATREQAAIMLERVHQRLYTPSMQLTSTENYTPLRIATPKANEDTEIPTTPLEPIVALYSQLQSLKDNGTDMNNVILCLKVGGVQTLTQDGKIIGNSTLTADEVSSILEDSDTNVYYSDRYESAYCIYSPNDYQSATIWYQSQESLLAKLRLARLFGVTNYTLG